MLRTPILIICGALLALHLRAQECSDVLVVAAQERIVAAELDSTGHWYAITKPFGSAVGLIVDGVRLGPYESVVPPRFSFDGRSYVAGVKLLGLWSVLTPSDTIMLPGEVLHEVRFPSLSDVPWWHHSNGDDHRISTRDRSFRCARPPAAICLDPAGTVAAWVERNGSVEIVMRNGREVARGEQISLSGVWSDGSVVYAARISQRWSVFVGDQEIVQSLNSIGDLQVNRSGTACGFHAADASGMAQMYLYTADMRDPWMSRPCDNVSGLILAPWEPLIAGFVMRNGNRSVSFNGTEYPAGQKTSPLAFTSDGAFLLYAGFDGEHFVTLNGKQFRVKGAVNLGGPLSADQSGTTVAWASSTTLAKTNLEYQVLRLGKMCDQMVAVVYNRSKNVFQGLGVMGENLFLLECKP